MAHKNVNTKTQKKISLDLAFDGGVQSHTRGILIREFLKYILYERQQMPIPYDQIKQSFKSSEEEQTQVASAMKQGKAKRPFASKMEHKKVSKVVASMEEMLKKIVETFEQCPEIRQILILLGGTVVSPKESFLINFPSYHPESTNLSSNVCVRRLMRELIGQDLVGKLKHIKVTNTIVMVKAPQDSGISWFLPKPNFKLPLRGEQLVFNFISNHNSDVFSHDLTHDEHQMEISGIEPFDVSGLDVSVEEQMMKLLSLNESLDTNSHTKLPVLASVEKSRRLSVNNNVNYVSYQDMSQEKVNQEKNLKSDNIMKCDKLTVLSSVEKNTKSVSNEISFNSTSSLSGDDTILQKTLESSKCVIDEDNDKSQNDIDCIWFQAPYVIKGYKDKISTKSGVL